MKVWVPFTNLNPATAYVVQGLPSYELVDVSGSDTAYVDFFQSRWDEGKDFISMEHDIVPWPGAIDQIAQCKAPWCVFMYDPVEDAMSRPNLGLVKIGADLIKMIPDVWRVMGTAERGVPRRYGAIFGAMPCNRTWMYCDQQLFFHAITRDIYPHQHFPPVVNVKPTNEIQRSR